MRALLASTMAVLLAALPLSALSATAPSEVPPDAPPAPTGTTASEVTAATTILVDLETETETGTPPALPPHLRSGAEIYAAFREGLADSECTEGSASARWSRHFAAAPLRLAEKDETLALFGYVVDAVRASHLPTEYALIPFVESGYKPEARSHLGPAGLWQFIAMTARNHKVPIRAGFDGRLSPVESTRAAVRYLKTLHGMFAGDWRLASMAYNAGEYRILGSLRRSGQVARSADRSRLPGLSGITQAYPRKIHALSCLLQQADDDPEWMAMLDRPVARLVAMPLPGEARQLDRWARAHGLDPAHLRRLNPAYAGGNVVRRGNDPMQVLAPALPPVHAMPE